jgi:hypothetical protein
MIASSFSSLDMACCMMQSLSSVGQIVRIPLVAQALDCVLHFAMQLSSGADSADVAPHSETTSDNAINFPNMASAPPPRGNLIHQKPVTQHELRRANVDASRRKVNSFHLIDPFAPRPRIAAFGIPPLSSKLPKFHNIKFL